MDCIKGILITKKDGNDDIPFAIDINGKFNPSSEENLHTTGLNVYGKINESDEYLYLVYYIADPGDYVVPNCAYTKEKDADAHLKYWNDDAGIMATGHYFLKEKVKILK